MASQSTISKLLLAATSFAGGMALGLLLAPRSGKENREWVNSQATELSNWAVKQQGDLVNKGEKQFKNIKSKVNRGIKDNVPDLYEATEHLNFDDSDFPNG